MTVLFGIRSPLVVDYEQTILRLGLVVAYGVSVSGHPRTSGPFPVVDVENLDSGPKGSAIVCAFSPKRRQQLAELAVEHGFDIAAALIDPTAILPAKLRVGKGSYINAGVTVGGGTILSDGALVNRSASLGHHTILDEYVSIGPGAILSGNIRVGARTVIGAGAVLQSNIRIGSDALISAGAVVRKHVPDGALVAGNPARELPFRPKRSSIDVDGGE